MTIIGVKELKNSLSRHLAEVRNGSSITVTDHGKPVAVISPIADRSRLEELIEQGIVTPRRNQGQRKAPEPIDAGVIISDLVDEQRR